MAAAYRSLRAIDWPLLILTLAICGMGVLQIYSATHDNIWRDAWWKQVVYLGAALVVLWIVMQIDYHTLLSYTPWLDGAAVAGLVAVLFVGTKVFGSRRWIPLP